jgi:O-antigen/teichoic acid export membrane protein
MNFLKKKLGETSTHLFKTFFVYGFIALTMIVIKVLIARFYGQEELGIFTYFFSLVSLVFLFTSFGFPEAITQTIIKEPSKLKSVLKLYWPFITLSTVIFTVLTVAITTFTGLNPQINYFWLAVVGYIIIYTLFYTTYSVLRGFKKFVDASLFSLVNRIFFIAFIVLAFLLSVSFVGVLLSMSLALVIATLFSLPKIKKLKNNFVVKTELKPFLYLSFSLFLMQVGFYSLRFLSEIVIGYLVDFNSLGLYSAYSSVTNVIRLVAYVFPVVVLPMAVVNKYKIKQSLKKIILILLPFSLIVLVATFVLVPLLYGQEYTNFYLPFFLVLSSTLLVVYSYFNSVFVGENKFSKFYLKILGIDFFLSLIVNTLLNIWLISEFGIVGAPIATTITIIFKILLNSYALKKLRR